jgi:hypothetical protein
MSAGPSLRTNALRRLFSWPLAEGTHRGLAYASSAPQKAPGAERAPYIRPGLPYMLLRRTPKQDDLVKLLRGLDSRPAWTLPSEGDFREATEPVESGEDRANAGDVAGFAEFRENASSLTNIHPASSSTHSTHSDAYSPNKEHPSGPKTSLARQKGAAHSQMLETREDHILQAYLTLRRIAFQRLEDLSIINIQNIMYRATLARSPFVLQTLLEDLPKLAGSDDSRVIALAGTMADALHNVNLLREEETWAILSLLGESRIKFLSRGQLRRLTHRVLTGARDSGREQAPELLAAFLQATLISLPEPVAGTDPGTEFVRTMERMAEMLVALGDLERGPLIYSSLTTLFRAGRFPASVIRNVDFASPDPRVTVLNIFVKTLLHWGHRRRAASLFCTYFPRLSPAVLGLDMVRALRSERTRSSLLPAKSVLLALLSSSSAESDQRIPDELLLEFYDGAASSELGQYAEEVYAASQAVHRADGRYPHPREYALPFLLRHIVYRSKNEHLARELVRHLVEKDGYISIQGRGTLIAASARAGFATEARWLWEKYATGKDAQVVTGHPAATVRLVRLFTHLANRHSANLGMPAPYPELPTLQSFDDKPAKEDGEEVPQLMDDDMPTSQVSLLGDPDEAEVSDPHERIEDIQRFVERVYREFVATKEPIRYAAHKDLTALARISFALGKVAEGFEALQSILDRKEIPNLYDVNVALGAVATHSPREAAALLRRMRQSGLRPNGVTFAIVIKQAFAKSDWALLQWLVSYARWLDHGEISLQGLSSVIRASVMDPEVDPRTRRANLHKARLALQALADEPYVASPALGMTCVRAALEADAPEEAYTFWRLLVRNRTDSQHGTQRVIRGRMVELLRRHSRLGRLPGRRMRPMIEDLREINDVPAREASEPVDNSKTDEAAKVSSAAE